MAGEDAAEGSGTRGPMGVDLNLYVGLPPLPPPRPWPVDTSAPSLQALMASSSTAAAAPGAPRTGGLPQPLLAPGVAAAVAAAEAAEEDGAKANFDCNICLELAREPVVTSCGHLFCWPCLYQWLRVETPFCECPVCKGDVIYDTLTPIYGRGGDAGDPAANPDVAPRPAAHRRESVREQLRMARNPRETAFVLRRMIRNQMSPSLAQHVTLAAPPPPSSVQQPSTSRTTVVIDLMDEPGPSRRPRSSVSPTVRRTRRRPQ